MDQTSTRASLSLGTLESAFCTSAAECTGWRSTSVITSPRCRPALSDGLPGVTCSITAPCTSSSAYRENREIPWLSVVCAGCSPLLACRRLRLAQHEVLFGLTLLVGVVRHGSHQLVFGSQKLQRWSTHPRRKPLARLHGTHSSSEAKLRQLRFHSCSILHTLAYCNDVRPIRLTRDSLRTIAAGRLRKLYRAARSFCPTVRN